MIVAALALAAAALSFEEQRIPGLVAERGHTLNALPSGPFLQADFDGDGHSDLLLPDGVAFQRDGGFPLEARVPVPGFEERPFADAWHGDLFLFFPNRIQRLRWREDAWRMVLDQSVKWPDSFAEAVREPEFAAAYDAGRNQPRLRIRRLLHDITGDGEPEIVVAAPTGLAVMRMEAERYRHSGLLEVFPPLRLARPPSLTIWPADERRVAFPVRQMTCRYFLDGGTITTVERTDSTSQAARYIVTRYAVELTDAGTLRAARESSTTTPPVSHSLRPWRLNEDGGVDFAGGELTQTRASLIPAPLYSTLASTDGGETIQEIRSLSFRPTVSFVDFNGNGELDLIAHHTGLYDGGTREAVARALTERRVSHRVSVHIQEDGVFTRTPSWEGAFTITLDQPPSRYSPMFRRYQTKELFDLGGDLDGDGVNDAVVQTRPDRLHVYRATDASFERRPVAEIPIAPDEGFLVMDVNGNGRGDIVIQPLVRPGDEPKRPARVLFSREGR